MSYSPSFLSKSQAWKQNPKQFFPALVVVILGFAAASATFYFMRETGRNTVEKAFISSAKHYIEGLRTRMNEALLLDPEAEKISTDAEFLAFVKKQQSLIPVEGIESKLVKEQNAPSKQDNRGAAYDFTYTEIVTLGQEHWVFIATPKSGFFEHKKWPEWTALLVGFGITLLIAGYIILVIAQREVMRVEMQEKEKLHVRLESSLEELKVAIVKAEAASMAKTEFLANISHELRTPMHAIINFCNICLKGLDKDDGQIDKEKQVKNLSKIKISGERLSRLLDDLLDLSKMEAGSMHYSMRVNSIPSLLDQVISETKELASVKALTIHSNAEIYANLTAEYDQGRFQQVLINLLSNAIKFTPEGKNIYIECEKSDDEIQISVRDEGVGIPENELETVFDKFVQSSKTKTGAGGTGLGLAITKEIMEAHYGTVYAKNNAQGGATFVITFPFEQPATPRSKSLIPQHLLESVETTLPDSSAA